MGCRNRKHRVQSKRGIPVAMWRGTGRYKNRQRWSGQGGGTDGETRQEGREAGGRAIIMMILPLLAETALGRKKTWWD